MASEIIFPIGYHHQRLESGLVLSECLFFPELSRIASSRERAIELLRHDLEELITKISPGELHRRRLATASTARWITLALDAPRKNEAWREPVHLRFPVVTWQHGSEAFLARVPGLAIEIVVPDLDELDECIEKEIVAALRRMGDWRSLQKLAWRQRATKFKVEWLPFHVKLPSLKQRAQRQEDKLGEEEPSTLKLVATLLEANRLAGAIEMDETVLQIADALTATRPQSVLLVGPSGVGKTAAVRALVRRRGDLRLALTPFFETSGARIVAGQCGFGMWQERCTNLVRECAKKRAVLHIGSLVELMEVGKSEYNQTGLAGFLRPAIARGELLCIAECTPEQLPVIEREDPQLADAFRQLRVEEPDVKRGRVILDRYANDGRKDLRSVTPSAVEMIDRLHRRYTTYSAIPGRPIRFLENLRRDGDLRTAATPTDVLNAFTRETGLPRVLLDPDVPLDIEATRRWFAQRVVGQSEAVDLVVDLLATVKAGLTRPHRPIASLLFIGPTGVGKTEMAKALAEFLFGSKDRLTRFDMSEYGDPVAVQRLTGTAFGAEGLLTAKVREQPFSVLLLDEFEKAHPAFFDLLLQVLGEARMTDAGGRLADFRNAVIILTSNLGAESYQAGHPGFRRSGQEQVEAKQHFVREVERFLRPEMFNRLDRLVPFAPLDAATIQKIAEREWGKVLNRDGIRFRGVHVTAADGVVRHLAAAGFDAKYGARPLKRAIERELLAPIAHRMNRYSAELAVDVNIALVTGRLSATVKPRQTDGRVIEAMRLTGDEVDRVRACIRLRRLHQLLEKSSVVRDIDNEVYQLAQVERKLMAKQVKSRPLTSQEQIKLARLGQLREVANEVMRQRAEAAQLEEIALVGFHTQSPTEASISSRLTRLTTQWDDLLLQLYRRRQPDSGELTVALFSEDKNRLFALAGSYARIAQNRGLNVMAVQYIVATQADPATFKAPRSLTDSGDALREWQKDYLVEMRRGEPLNIILKRDLMDVPFTRDDLHSATVGIGLHVAGVEAVLRFQDEAGLHEFQVPPDSDGSDPDVLVETEAGKLDAYLPPERIERRGGIKAQSNRRIYSADKRCIVDPTHESSLPWQGDLFDAVNALTALNMRAELMQLVLE